MLVLGAMVLGLLVESGFLPDIVVQRGEDLSARARRELLELGVITEAEEIIYFYSAGFTSYKEDGNFFTPTRVVSYETVDGEFWMAEARFEDITDITFEDTNSFLEDSVITIHPRDAEPFILIVSNEEDKDAEFCRVLMETWQARRPTSATEAGLH